MFFALKVIQRISFPLRGKAGMGVGSELFNSVMYSRADNWTLTAESSAEQAR